ncbi:copper resistance CopC/CopD family protein [Bacillus benzoevorans]|uniref:Copper transport protein n=1 Tax=Bacillus benzoevorans TaxID=1456 RepID=A0A7X0HUP3_9BACI|nr:copper resistance protein CopC [Bacillus benzoevorans]MBB6447229.1 copper transport protein [Bacillus benzoevorans]
MKERIVQYRKIPLLCLSFLFLMIPHEVFAHAQLEKAEPAPDSTLTALPEEIVLTFNERLEKELFSIKVFNEAGEQVSKSETEMSKDQKTITQDLPSLPEGNYAISYSVLSADGHPIKGSYVVSIGEKTAPRSEMNQLHNEENPSLLSSMIQSVSRILYYLALLLTAGWMIWGTVNKIEHGEMRAAFRQKARYLQAALLITTIGMGYFQFAELLNSWSADEIWPLLTGTALGISWLLSMVLSILGFALLLRFTWLDRLWVFVILTVKSINGHAMAFDPPILTIAIDVLHLFAASIWAGGLFYIFAFWKKQREHVRQFLPAFSQAAFISILVLMGTGAASTFLFLPQIGYLFDTKWGILLLIKAAIVLLVTVTGGILRYSWKKRSEHAIGRLLKIDFSLMLVIVGIVGVFTHLSPLPQNEPLEWHEQEKHLEFTTSIFPKAPGSNHFMVEAGSLQEGIEIKNVELFLKYQDNPDVAPIQVPFSQAEQSGKVHYMIDGQYLPFAGNWTAELRILDSEDNEGVFSTEFMVY